MPLLDHRVPDRLREVALPRAWRAEKERVLVLRHEATGRELEDELAIHLLVEVEIESIERLAVVAKRGVLDAASEQSVLARDELVLDERGEKVDRRLLLGLCLQDARLEDGGHAGEPQLTERAAKFDHVHGWSPSVFWSMSSR